MYPILLSIYPLSEQHESCPLRTVGNEFSSGAPVNKVADCGSVKGLARVVCLVYAFKATLTSEQLATLQLPYSKADAARWSNLLQAFTRQKRIGLSFSLLNATQIKAAMTLLPVVLAQNVPNEGYDEMESGLAADDYLAATLGRSEIFGSGYFYMAFPGIPSTPSFWELQFGATWQVWRYGH